MVNLYQPMGDSCLTISEMEITWAQWMCLKLLWYKDTCDWRSSHWLISIPDYNCIMKTKEHSKQLCKNVVEKRKSRGGYKNISKKLNLPLELS